MSKLYLWTDGGCNPNPGTGGWAYLLESARTGRKKMRSGRLPNSTNNRAELTAVINGLQTLRNGPHEVVIYTDSEYVRRAVEGMRKATTNHDLLQRIRELCGLHEVRVMRISGHSGIEKNELCDRMAAEAIVNGR